jgi:DNA polymerase III epsilon subunit-like protein
MAMKLVAIDFETADCSADSACALGIVSIEKGKITKKGYRLIRPPRRHFIFSYIHGISWADVEPQPTFIEVWDHFAPFWKDADYFLAHYAPFDRNVLTACCSAARLSRGASQGRRKSAQSRLAYNGAVLSDHGTGRFAVLLAVGSFGFCFAVVRKALLA